VQNIQYNTKFVKRHVAVASEALNTYRCVEKNKQSLKFFKKGPGNKLANTIQYLHNQAVTWHVMVLTVTTKVSVKYAKNFGFLQIKGEIE